MKLPLSRTPIYRRYYSLSRLGQRIDPHASMRMELRLIQIVTCGFPEVFAKAPYGRPATTLPPTPLDPAPRFYSEGKNHD